jgi:hypothetical protein
VLARATTTSTNGSGITGSRESFRMSTHLIIYSKKKLIPVFGRRIDTGTHIPP